MTKLDKDVLIIGAGLSGIGAAVHLHKLSPGKTYRIYEARDAIGGTWDLFRYPGIRSDSDMHTLGFDFKPWTEAKAIADGPSIRKYVNDTADEYGVRPHISFNTKIVSADWSSKDQAWHVVSEGKDGARQTTVCRFLFMCGGYYRYDQGYRPEFPDEAAFKGQIIHPQHWPEDLDYSGKRVVVIGSGATAMTLVPAMAETAAHITMLQRSPTYVVSRPAVDKMANFLRQILPDQWAYTLIRWRNVLFQQFFFRQTRKNPDKARERLIGMVREEMGPGYDVDKHFNPAYNPWEQRLCLVPDSDLFNALKSGKASVETDHIERFTETGILLKSGKTLDADIIVTATGLNLIFMNGVQVSLDGAPVDPGRLLNYKGVMLSNMPNLAVTFGYTNASWTLKADLTSEYVCRLLNLMDEKGATSAMPYLAQYPNETEPFVDFSSGYFQRVMDQFPRQHTEAPWKLHQNYFADRKNLREQPIEDGVMQFTVPAAPASAKSELQAAE
ncbi:MAG: NAD(P)/FAD-dependent oxidoreductase [Hyphomonas sp.]|uniref:flavin-containing monooxygenase n=1 Tax=Hyphomonas sp. TaxID=87 RepID=UPI00182FB4E3|nr:NAD(P)/FAD-dependent oxidoreductase [Hyphomonas sp.]MBA3068701.1 NAD(P)/FAD-dependent oxidoreductase [Hyphomonas sp.]MBU4063636.1 NAD(P)/FAD-dependent oxidoreductase [Alphaproteobacteria bacterium]MBU4165739.1 NAD(P)/FAD-dependent oxidoreductase [Alphaproteobacteria bacterium]